MVPPRLKLVSNDALSADDDLRDNVSNDCVPVDALANLAALQMAARAADAKRTLEALLFAASAPLDESALARQLPADTNIPQLIAALQTEYATRGVNLVKVGGGYAFRTAQDLSHLLERHAVEERKLSKAALETLAIIAYHQPVTRAEVEEIRGVSTSKGSLDVLLETRWIRPRGRRRAPGRPITYGTTAEFLNHFGLDAIKDLPGLAELKGAGLLDGNLPPDFKVPEPSDLAALMPDELPLDSSDEPEAETDPDLFAPLPDEDDEATSEG
jgi:segregation and condensation protein B